MIGVANSRGRLRADVGPRLRLLRHGGGGVGQTPDVWGNDYFDDT